MIALTTFILASLKGIVFVFTASALLFSLLMSASTDLNDRSIKFIKTHLSELGSSKVLNNKDVDSFVTLIRLLAQPLLVIAGLTSIPISSLSHIQDIFKENFVTFLCFSEAIVIIVFLIEQRTPYLSRHISKPLLFLYYVVFLILSAIFAIVYVCALSFLTSLNVDLLGKDLPISFFLIFFLIAPIQFFLLHRISRKLTRFNSRFSTNFESFTNIILSFCLFYYASPIIIAEFDGFGIASVEFDLGMSYETGDQHFPRSDSAAARMYKIATDQGYR